MNAKEIVDGIKKKDTEIRAKREALSRKSESAGYADGLFQLMEDLIKKADDTVWLMDHETVFERCWMIIEQQEGRERLEERFPDYA